MKLIDLLVRSAISALDLQDKTTGSMPPGHNGPYHDSETPVRNTSHWLITFLKAYQISNDHRFLNAAVRAVNYLTSDCARPMKASFWHRKNPKKDTCNGLIGQAWTIEALVAAAGILEDRSLIDLAEEVFLLHPFDETGGLWLPVSVDGTHLFIDMSFNHQLWFAAAGAMLGKHGGDKVNSRVACFLNKIDTNLLLYSDGLIRHLLCFNHLWRQKPQSLVYTAFIHSLKNRKKLYYKAIGYHAFNLYGMALLKQIYPDHPFWNSRKHKTLFEYACCDEYKSALAGNVYGYPYNPPGIEMAFALEVFADRLVNIQEEQERWLSEQFSRSLSPETCLMDRNTEDANTSAARIYEVTRVSNLNLNFDI